MGLGGWAISPQCFAWILDNVPSGSKVLEFGSGMGTGELVKHFDMTSIEQDSFWMNGFTGSRYIYAPIVDDWYSWEALENGNLENDYFLIIVDGPSKRMRKGMQDFYLAHPEIFDNSLILFDDTNRAKDMEVCEWFISQGFQRVAEMSDDEKQFTVVSRENLIN